jgi:hypothetical protein
VAKIVSSHLFKVVQEDKFDKTQYFVCNTNAPVYYVLVLLFLEEVCHDLKGKFCSANKLFPCLNDQAT